MKELRQPNQTFLWRRQSFWILKNLIRILQKMWISTSRLKVRPNTCGKVKNHSSIKTGSSITNAQQSTILLSLTLKIWTKKSLHTFKQTCLLSQRTIGLQLLTLNKQNKFKIMKTKVKTWFKRGCAQFLILRN